MKPRLFACYFQGDGPNSAFYERMAKVLEFTATRHCPDWEIDIRRTDPGKYSNQHTHSHTSNTHKLDHWNRFVQESTDGDRILLMDGDMMILRGLDDIWERDFDLAYTNKRAKLPFNGVILFLRSSEKTRRFMQAYWDKNMELLAAPQKHAPFRAKYGGMNQAAFGALLPEIETTFGLKLIGLPCTEWNCEQSAWPTFDPSFTRIVHIKSGLRKAVFGRGMADGTMIPIIEVWKRLERESEAARTVHR